MVDGAASLMTAFWGRRAMGLFDEAHRGGNMLDGGAPFYDTYETADGRYIAVGAIEGQFFGELLERVGLAGVDVPAQFDVDSWPILRERLAQLFRTKTRAQWCDLLEGTDACVAPVLTMSEAAAHDHIRARGTIVEHGGVLQAAPAPRFSRTPGAIRCRAPRPGADTREALMDWGFSADEVSRIGGAGALAVDSASDDEGRE
jgi:alpha-methylacyl-CoA racemase